MDVLDLTTIMILRFHIFPMPEKYAGKEDRYWAKEIVSLNHTFLYQPNIVCNHFFTKNGATWKGLG